MPLLLVVPAVATIAALVLPPYRLTIPFPAFLVEYRFASVPPSIVASVALDGDCPAGFDLDIVIDSRKPNGREWDYFSNDTSPDPVGQLTLHDGEVGYIEVLAQRKDRFRLTVPFFNGKSRKRVSRSSRFDLDIVDVDVGILLNQLNPHDFIASFEGVSLEMLLDGGSVRNGSATITGARCLSR